MNGMDIPTIVLMSDFGLKDNYVGVMKGVIAKIAPKARIIDLTHDIEPQNYKQAAYILVNSIPYFTKGAIFVSVVDPGVGTARNAIAMKAGGNYFIAPDNGLLSYVMVKDHPDGIYSLSNMKYFLEDISATFHGRDIFAPVAAYIANGVEIKEFGERISPISLITIPEPQCFLDAQNIWHGEVLHIDRFGNIVTSLKAELMGIDVTNFPKQNLNWIVESANIKIRYLSQTFADVDVNHYLAYIGSYGYLEIGCRDSNAAQKSGLTVGQNVYAYKF